MNPRCDPPPALLRLAEHQAGALSREQAVALGLPANAITRLVRQGYWRRLGTGVYATSAPSWTTWAWWEC